MSQSIEERLSGFTPDASGLDRDALLFAVGQASARPNRGYRALATGLVVSQALTLALLGYQWTRPTPSGVLPDAVVPTSPAPPSMSPPRDEMLTHLPQRDEARFDWPRSTGIEDLVPDAPPLRAWSVGAVEID